MNRALPKRWHEVRDQRTNDLLYWRREHSGYEVHPDGSRFRCELDWLAFDSHATLRDGIFACRDHMHANNSGATA